MLSCTATIWQLLYFLVEDGREIYLTATLRWQVTTLMRFMTIFVKAGTLFWARVPVQTAFNSVLLCLPIDIEHGKFRRKMLAIT